MRRPFTATDVPGLTSTAVPQPPALPAKPDPYAEGYAAGRLEERVAVVAWLRGQRGAGGSALVPSVSTGLAHGIERGKHITDPAFNKETS